MSWWKVGVSLLITEVLRREILNPDSMCNFTQTTFMIRFKEIRLAADFSKTSSVCCDVQTERVCFLDQAESSLAATCEVIIPLSEKVGEPLSSKMWSCPLIVDWCEPGIIRGIWLRNRGKIKKKNKEVTSSRWRQPSLKYPYTFIVFDVFCADFFFFFLMLSGGKAFLFRSL